MIKVASFVSLPAYLKIYGRIKDGKPFHFKEELNGITLEIFPNKGRDGMIVICNSQLRSNHKEFKFNNIKIEEYGDLLMILKNVIQPCSYEIVGVKDEQQTKR